MSSDDKDTNWSKPNVWGRITADPQLARARKKLSIHELRLIIGHAVAGDDVMADPTRADNLAAVAALDRERIGQLIYEAVYASQGGKWSAVEPREVWFAKADWFLAQIKG